MAWRQIWIWIIYWWTVEGGDFADQASKSNVLDDMPHAALDQVL